MANTIGIFVADPIETGGANALTGLRTGTRVSSGTELVPLLTTEVGTVYTAYMRVVDADGDDPGKDSGETMGIDTPTGMEGCATSGGTFSASPLTLGAIATGGNLPFFLKPTEAIPEAYSLDLTYGALFGGALAVFTLVDGTRVAQVGTVTLTLSDAGLSAEWDAVTSADGYEVQYKASSSSTWLDATDVTSPSAIGSLTNGTAYDVRVRAYDERGIGAYSATATAVSVFWSDDFEDGTFDTTTLWRTSTTGTWTIGETGGILTITPGSTQGVDYGVVAARLPVKTDRDGKITVTEKLAAAADVNTTMNFAPMNLSGFAYTDTYASTTAPFLHQSDPANARVRFLYYTTDTTPSARSLKSDGTWATDTTVYYYASSLTAESDVTYNVEIDHANTRWRVVSTTTAGTVTSDWVAFSSTNVLDAADDDLYLYLARRTNSATQNFKHKYKSVAYGTL